MEINTAPPERAGRKRCLPHLIIPLITTECPEQPDGRHRKISERRILARQISTWDQSVDCDSPIELERIHIRESATSIDRPCAVILGKPAASSQSGGRPRSSSYRRERMCLSTANRTHRDARSLIFVSIFEFTFLRRRIELPVEGDTLCATDENSTGHFGIVPEDGEDRPH